MTYYPDNTYLVVSYRHNSGGVAKPVWHEDELRIKLTYDQPGLPLIIAKCAAAHADAVAIELVKMEVQTK